MFFGVSLKREDFVKRGVNILFPVDNIDLLDDTPTGQNTFHGTVFVSIQRADDGDAVNQSPSHQDQSEFESENRYRYQVAFLITLP